MTRRNIPRLAVLLIMSVGLLTPASAKRKAPPELKPIEFGENTLTPSTEKCGIVTLTNKKSGKVIRSIRFYRVFYKPLLERDVQDVWFTDFFRTGDDVWARDEKGRIYKMLLKLMKASRINYITQEDFEKKKKDAQR